MRYIAIVRRLPCELNISCTSTTAESRAKIWYQQNAFKPPPPPHPRWLRLLSVLLLFTFCLLLFPIVVVCNCSMFYYTLLYVHSSSAIILMGKRELVALLSVSSWCLVIVVWLFLAVPWGCLQFVSVLFPGHTHYFRDFFQIFKFDQ